jgi:hypothetical protein
MHVSVAAKIKDQVEKQQFADAEQSWSELESVVLQSSNSVVSKAVPSMLFLLPLLHWFIDL